MRAITTDGIALEFASEALRNNSEVCLFAVTQDERAMESISERLKGDRDFLLGAISANSMALERVDKQFRHDRDFIQAACGRKSPAPLLQRKRRSKPPSRRGAPSPLPKLIINDGRWPC
mmetsp:Transcript_59825/g.185541  ORF Transcript_59825/g.185541 Transcript_59825/m.185541 type:complete len:119 (-) Transcript_59825:96-452(-)